MHSSDFSVAFLETLTADMRELTAPAEDPVVYAPRVTAAAVTFVSALFTLISVRWM